MGSIESLLLRLERAMLDPSRRRNFEELADVLAEDFVEFGSSGKVYDKQQVVAAVKAQAADPKTALVEVAIEDFRVRQLAPDLALVTYTASIASAGESGKTQPSRRFLRSSIWRLRGDSAQIVFHQGTIAPD